MSHQLSEDDLRRAADSFEVLGHPGRVRIAFRLSRGHPLTQHQLLDDLPWGQSTLARHAGMLRARGLITGCRHGNEVRLRLADDLVPQLLTLIRHHLSPAPADTGPIPPAPPGGASHS